MSSKVKLFVFDIDGTLANIDHRKHHLVSKGKKKNWEPFFRDQHLDEPHWPVFDVMKALTLAGNVCIVITGRMEQHREASLKWIQEHYELEFDNDNLIMRADGDRTDDDELKWNIVQDILYKNPNLELAALFDDRHRIIDKFRQNGVYAFECNQYREEF